MSIVVFLIIEIHLAISNKIEVFQHKVLLELLYSMLSIFFVFASDHTSDHVRPRYLRVYCNRKHFVRLS